ncbi:MAG TPA: heterodisulfide reductase-related iron-sulfur binding cluster [Nocardioidaceae bacterium]|jgi:glycolate oxidase iron-sulfur subunit|nr:heterodisulfide reductase-related iron-sulfur binding cluster [Nocardioidaceae bacterium]
MVTQHNPPLETNDDAFAPAPFQTSDELDGMLGDCVHCGFCLPTCPTYSLWGEEMDSPRGRIHLVEQAARSGQLPESTVGHLDACLGCMACVTACPSGVKYDQIIERARAEVETTYQRPRGQRALREAIFALFPYPRRLRVMRGPLAVYQRSGLQRLVRRSGLLERLPNTLQTMEGVAPTIRARTSLPERIPARGTRRAVVGMLTGCVQREFFPGVNDATARVLAAEGCDVVVPQSQGCCGALSVHSGRKAEAQRFARRLLDSFADAGVEWVVVNSAGCGSSMKEYGELLADDPHYAEAAAGFAAKVRDITELLVELGPVAPRHPLPVTVAYHDACHLAHAQGVRTPPRALLGAIPELTVMEIGEGGMCCGSAGVYNLLNPRPARQLGDRKAEHVAATGADLLVTANPGCLLQISSALSRAGTSMSTAHTVEVLDASIAGHPPTSLTER